MLIPLFVLALGAIFAGLLFREPFIGEAAGEFWKQALYYAPSSTILTDFHHVPAPVALAATIMMITGFVLATWMYVFSPDTPARIARRHGIVYRFLLHKWYFDELYDFIFVRPAFWLGRLFWKGGDGKIIDGLGPDGVSARVLDAAGRVARIQSGFVYHYAFAMLIGVAAFITWYLIGGVR